MYSLQDKVALVTGGSLGIGKATAQQLKNLGARVIITGRNEARLSAAAHELGVDHMVGDVSKEEDVVHLFAKIRSDYGKLDVLVNNAGIGTSWDEVDQLKWEDFEKVYSVNVFGAAMVAREAARIFKKQNSGNILNIASTAGVKGFARGSVYAGSKFALRGMTECWRAELRKHNVRVMLINPSEVTTAFGNEERKERAEEASKLRSEEIAHSIVSALQMDQRGFIPELTVWATNPT